ncbi:hypothetical protein IPA_01650 [Ignicoccus pacificus DSM 13166]|uniref:CRISPR type III-associated protein domain-containing protein n=1 Tax=Ignicoccus pacificus DSM 13166 TaxID=940294 RepID=A0A977KAM7_9CREN|nr:hypothetical protein IPA_01650 [Ignicoccus pacificus DSM 13166]
MRVEMNGKRPDLIAFEEFVKTIVDAYENPEGAASMIKNLKRSIILKLESETLDYVPKIFELIRRLNEMKKEALKRNGYWVGYVQAKLVSPGLVGSSEGIFKTVFEVGLTLDKVLGVPFYPSSSVKGVVRSRIKNMLEKEDKNVEEVVQELFGDMESEGNVIFMDAYPIGCIEEQCSLFSGAVITPHYYKGGQVVDNELGVKPVPIPHLVVSPGLVFEFIIGVRRDGGYTNTIKMLGNGSIRAHEIPQKVLIKIMSLLVEELQKGAFGRASKGFNVFEPDKGLIPSQVRALGIL